MADADVGDAVIDVDPTVDRLERMTAELLGKEAAAFMPSGSMTNQIALRVHCGRSSEFICEVDSHIYNYEQGAFAQLSGLVARTLAGECGVLTVEQLQDVIRPENEHMVRTELICIENTHNRWGGRIQPQEEVLRICEWADANGVKKHLDGARLWNAAAATGLSEQELAAPFDSVSVCFSKGLGAPVGSILAGPKPFIAEAQRARKLFGGGMRQVGIIAAGAIYAIENHRQRLVEDHQAAQRLAEVCDSCEPLSVRGNRVDSNMLVLEVDPAWGTANQLVSMLTQRDLHCFAISPQAVRFVTHLDVNQQQIMDACEIIQTVISAPVAQSV